MNNTLHFLTILLISIAGPAMAGAPRFDPVVKNLEGWNAHIEPRLLAGDKAGEDARALAMLANHLQRIAILMPEASLARMRKLEIWIEHDHPELKEHDPVLFALLQEIWGPE